MALTRLKTDGFALLPSLQSERARSLRACRRITQVKISDSIKITYYTIQVFYEKPTRNIPTCRRSKLSHIDCNKPDAVVLQRFSAFASLCHELSYHAEEGHGFQLCPFCEALTSTLRLYRPRIRTKLLGTDVTMHKQLERLINSDRGPPSQLAPQLLQ